MGRLIRLALILIFSSGFATLTKAQDIHYSMFYNGPQILNPALTGIFYGDSRIMGHYRRQWKKVPVDYMTFSGTYDMKVYPKKQGNDFWGFGLNFNYDRAGFSKLSLTNLQLGASYSKELSSNVFLTGGAQLGFSQRAFKTDELTFDNQFLSGAFDPTAPSGEDLTNTSFFFVDLGVGGNLRLQNEDRRSKLDLGLSLYHLLEPNQSFFDDSGVNLPRRLAVHALGALKVADPLDILLRGTAQFQSSYKEFVPGIAARIYLDQKKGKELAFQFGINARFNSITDAIIPTIEVHYRTLSVGASYDVNVSQFEIATDGAGGPEIWVSYRIVKVKPLNDFKTCPIF